MDILKIEIFYKLLIHTLTFNNVHFTFHIKIILIRNNIAVKMYLILIMFKNMNKLYILYSIWNWYVYKFLLVKTSMFLSWKLVRNRVFSLNKAISKHNDFYEKILNKIVSFEGLKFVLIYN